MWKGPVASFPLQKFKTKTVTSLELLFWGGEVLGGSCPVWGTLWVVGHAADEPVLKANFDRQALLTTGRTSKYEWPCIRSISKLWPVFGSWRAALFNI